MFNFWIDYIKFCNDSMKFWNYVNRLPETPDCFLQNEILIENKAFVLRKVQDGKIGNKPILVGPPNAGHLSFIATFKKDKSVVEKFMKMFPDHPICFIEWLPATFERRNESVDDLVLQVDECVEKLGGSVHLCGLCMAGLLFSIYAARFPEKIDKTCGLITMGSPLNTEGDITSDMYRLVHKTPMCAFKNLVDCGGGVLLGEFSIIGFKTLNHQKAYNMYVQRYFNLWQDIVDDNEENLERYKDFWDWMDNPSRISGRWYLKWVYQIFKKNNFFKGELEVLGETVGFGNIKARVVNFAGRDDDVTYVKDVFTAKSKYSVNVMNILIKGVGHIGLYISKKSLSQVDEGFIYAITGKSRDKLLKTMQEDLK